MAVLRYYLSYDNDEDLARGLLILFLPFRNEMEEIHLKDVIKLLGEKRKVVEEKQKYFEKYKVMTDLINQIHKQQEKKDEPDDEQDEPEENETTCVDDIEDFNNWAKNQAIKELSKFKDLTEICEMEYLRKSISELNEQQRRIFDDFCERMVSMDINEPSIHLFIAGNAGTGKSHLVRLMIEAVQVIKLKAGDDLKKPPVLTMAPTANAAFIIGGRTIDSCFGFSPMDSRTYSQIDHGRMSKMKFQYEDVEVMFIDEISMVGSLKLT
jgi:hypothetical protein